MSVKQNLDRKRKSKYRKILTLKNVLGLGAGFGLRAGYWKGWEINGLCSGFGARESGQGLGWAYGNVFWGWGKNLARVGVGGIWVPEIRLESGSPKFGSNLGPRNSATIKK